MIIPQIAFCAGSVDVCTDLGAVRDAVTAEGGRVIELTQDQLQFLRGIYVMNPEPPGGLPYGDRAMLVQVDGHSDGLVLFVDGDQACNTMHAPPEVLLLMHEVTTGNIDHHGAGL
jgi:hypothetical protein